MTPTYSEISLLKLVLADYLQVLELHLFAILQMWKTLMPGRGAGTRGKATLIPGITWVARVNGSDVSCTLILAAFSQLTFGRLMVAHTEPARGRTGSVSTPLTVQMNQINSNQN